MVAHHLVEGLLDGLPGVDEVASVPIDAELIDFKTSALFGFVLGVEMVVFLELVETMGKFASFIVRAVPVLHVSFAQLRLLFVIAFEVIFG